jgi:hypothetical protein
MSRLYLSHMLSNVNYLYKKVSIFNRTRFEKKPLRGALCTTSSTHGVIRTSDRLWSGL